MNFRGTWRVHRWAHDNNMAFNDGKFKVLHYRTTESNSVIAFPLFPSSRLG